MEHNKIIIKYSIWSFIIWVSWLIYRDYDAKSLIGTGWQQIGVDIWMVLSIILFICIIGGYQVEILTTNNVKKGYL